MDIQEENEFQKETDALRDSLKANTDELPSLIGISRATFYAYRSGSRHVSNKSWRKLEKAKQKLGFANKSKAQSQENTPSPNPALERIFRFIQANLKGESLETSRQLLNDLSEIENFLDQIEREENTTPTA